MWHSGKWQAWNGNLLQQKWNNAGRQWHKAGLLGQEITMTNKVHTVTCGLSEVVSAEKLDHQRC